MSIRNFFYDTYIEMSAGFASLLCIVVWYWKNDANHILGFTLAAISFALWIKARYDLGTSFSVLPRASKLVKHGLYSKIRHPVYVFSTLFVLGIVIALEQKILYVLPFLLAAVQYLRAKRESQVLSTRFGDAYTAYRKQTWF